MLHRLRGLMIILRVPAPFLLVAALVLVAAQARSFTPEWAHGCGMLLGKAPPKRSQVAGLEHRLAELQKQVARLR